MRAEIKEAFITKQDMSYAKNKLRVPSGQII